MFGYLSSSTYTHYVKKCCLSIYLHIKHIIIRFRNKNKRLHHRLRRSQNNEREIKLEYKYLYKNDM